MQIHSNALGSKTIKRLLVTRYLGQKPPCRIGKQWLRIKIYVVVLQYLTTSLAFMLELYH